MEMTKLELKLIDAYTILMVGGSITEESVPDTQLTSGTTLREEVKLEYARRIVDIQPDAPDRNIMARLESTEEALLGLMVMLMSPTPDYETIERVSSLENTVIEQSSKLESIWDEPTFSEVVEQVGISKDTAEANTKEIASLSSLVVELTNQVSIFSDKIQKLESEFDYTSTEGGEE